MAIEPRVELAARRAVFHLGLVFIWLAVGSVVIRLVRETGVDKAKAERVARLDFHRTEMLKILWSESLARDKTEWASLANAKMDVYERELLSSAAQLRPVDKSWAAAFRDAFALVTSIGPVRGTDFSTVGKLTAFFYASLGVPLVLLFLAQCSKIVQALFPGPTILWATIAYLFFSAVLYDVVETSTDDVPFGDALFSIFLSFSTIGEDDPLTSTPATYVLCLIGLSILSCAFVYIQRLIENTVASYEFGFAVSGCGEASRWIANATGGGNTDDDGHDSAFGGNNSNGGILSAPGITKDGRNLKHAAIQEEDEEAEEREEEEEEEEKQEQ